MTSSQSEPGYIKDIVDAAERAQEFIARVDFADFTDDAKTVYATIRALEVLGEAANRIQAGYQQMHPGIPWRNMINMRNRLIHNYDNIDLRIVWAVVVHDLFPLIANLGADGS